MGADEAIARLGELPSTISLFSWNGKAFSMTAEQRKSVASRSDRKWGLGPCAVDPDRLEDPVNVGRTNGTLQAMSLIDLPHAHLPKKAGNPPD
jgi:hypothetical protein